MLTAQVLDESCEYLRPARSGPGSTTATVASPATTPRSQCGVVGRQRGRFRLAQAMALDHDGLPATERDLLIALLPQLDPVIRQTLGASARARSGRRHTRADGCHASGGGPLDQLVRCGLITPDEDGLRISLGAGNLPIDLQAGPRHITSAVRALLAWTTTTAPAMVASNGPAIARLAELALDAGYAGLACQLARAAAPAIGASLRWGSWRTILAHGEAAAEKTHDQDALEYFRNENRIRSIGLGTWAAAGAIGGAVTALWPPVDDAGPALPPGAEIQAGPPPVHSAPPPAVPGPPPVDQTLPSTVDLGSTVPETQSHDATIAATTSARRPPVKPAPRRSPPSVPASHTPHPVPDPKTWLNPPATSGQVPPTPVAPMLLKFIGIIVAIVLGGVATHAVSKAITDALAPKKPLPTFSTSSGLKLPPNGDTTQRGTVYLLVRSKHLTGTEPLSSNTTCQVRVPGELGVSVSETLCTMKIPWTDNRDVAYRVTPEDGSDIHALR
jgi:hypothetical protein